MYKSLGSVLLQTYRHVGSADPATHKIYIWDVSNDGQFVTALDGGREPLLDVTVESMKI